MAKSRYIVGVDPGDSTGVCLLTRYPNQIIEIKTIRTIHGFFRWVDETVYEYHPHFKIEDSRLNKMPPSAGDPARATGAAVNKWYCKQIELFMKDRGYSYEMVKPNYRSVKLKEDTFRMITKISPNRRTSQHARDACMLVWGE